MKSINKTKALVTIIIFLLITNIAMLIFFIVLSKPVGKTQRDHDHNEMYNSLQNKVGFSKDQLDKYQALRNEQRGKVKPLFNELRAAKKDFYALMYSKDISDSLLNADADLIAQKQKMLDLQMLRYFKNIRNLSSTEQLPKFDSTINTEILKMVGGRPGKNRQERSK
jgi:hypothetical protein